MAQETVIEIKHVATENSQKSAGKAEKGALDGDDVFEHSSPIITDGRNAALDNSETFKLVPPSSGALDDHTDIARQRIVIDDVLVDSESAFSRGRSSAAPSRMLQSKASGRKGMLGEDLGPSALDASSAAASWNRAAVVVDLSHQVPGGVDDFIVPQKRNSRKQFLEVHQT